MQININSIVSVSETNQSFSRVARIAEENAPILVMTDDEKIDVTAAQVLDRFRLAFEELAK